MRLSGRGQAPAAGGAPLCGCARRGETAAVGPRFSLHQAPPPPRHPLPHQSTHHQPPGGPWCWRRPGGSRPASVRVKGGREQKVSQKKPRSFFFGRRGPTAGRLVSPCFFAGGAQPPACARGGRGWWMGATDRAVPAQPPSTPSQGWTHRDGHGGEVQRARVGRGEESAHWKIEVGASAGLSSRALHCLHLFHRASGPRVRLAHTREAAPSHSHAQCPVKLPPAPPASPGAAAPLPMRNQPTPAPARPLPGLAGARRSSSPRPTPARAPLRKPSWRPCRDAPSTGAGMAACARRT